jgi:tRNA pseudouridine38-40 synthase
VHARGQAAHLRVGDRWTTPALRRAMNALLPADVWVAGAEDVPDGFHARYSATARRYTYYVGTDEASASPFRRPYEWGVGALEEPGALDECARALLGEHRFYGFAVRGTAPQGDEHRCTVVRAEWRERVGGLEFIIEANRFLHHMVRFLVGTMVDVARGRRSVASFTALLDAEDNRAVSPPAPAHGLFLDHVTYPLNTDAARAAPDSHLESP